MQAIRLEEPGRLAAVSVPEPEAPGADEARVRVRRVGVCGTDYHAFRGRQTFFTYPRILGHELGVEVLEVGEAVTNVRPGDRCAVEPYLNCGHCIACRRGKPNCCARLQVLGVHVDGGLCEQLVLPARKLHPSSRLTFDQLALVETLGIGAHAVDRAGVEAGEFALVLGAGPIGLTAMQFAAGAGAQVIAADVNPQRLQFCQERQGVSHVIHADREDIGTALKDITGGDGPTAVFDATGSSDAMAAAFAYPSPGGRLALIGHFPGDITFSDPDFHRRELTLLASRNARPADFTRILGLLEAGRIDTTPWITHRAPFDEAVPAFSSWLEPEAGVLKAVISLD